MFNILLSELNLLELPMQCYVFFFISYLCMDYFNMFCCIYRGKSYTNLYLAKLETKSIEL